tara:strand:+ start:5484 stop:5774 length:291 start_codon:yes stop_codon:yes gene_type:complete
MAFYQLKVYRKYTETPLILFLVDAQSGDGDGYGDGYGYELGRWVQNRHGGGGLPSVDSCSSQPDTKEANFKKREGCYWLSPLKLRVYRVSLRKNPL